MQLSASHVNERQATNKINTAHKFKLSYVNDSFLARVFSKTDFFLSHEQFRAVSVVSDSFCKLNNTTKTTLQLPGSI